MKLKVGRVGGLNRWVREGERFSELMAIIGINSMVKKFGRIKTRCMKRKVAKEDEEADEQCAGPKFRRLRKFANLENSSTASKTLAFCYSCKIENTKKYKNTHL